MTDVSSPPAERTPPSVRVPLVVALAAVVLVVALLRYEGRVWLCAADSGWMPWCGDAWSRHTSQHLLDPYSFTHLLHGFLFCGLLSLVGRGRLSLPWLLCLAVIGEGAWELIENSAAVIARYRANTASLEYAGDSILNSLGDLISCSTGVWLSHRLGWRRAVLTFLAVEVALVLWIRDSLLINILMLLHPIEAVRLWQQG